MLFWFEPEIIEPVVYKILGLPWWIALIAIFLFAGILSLNLGIFLLELLNKRK